MKRAVKYLSEIRKKGTFIELKRDILCFRRHKVRMDYYIISYSVSEKVGGLVIILNI